MVGDEGRHRLAVACARNKFLRADLANRTPNLHNF
jgi:hypothetical protein